MSSCVVGASSSYRANVVLGRMSTSPREANRCCTTPSHVQRAFTGGPTCMTMLWNGCGADCAYPPDVSYTEAKRPFHRRPSLDTLVTNRIFPEGSGAIHCASCMFRRNDSPPGYSVGHGSTPRPNLQGRGDALETGLSRGSNSVSISPRRIA